MNAGSSLVRSRVGPNAPQILAFRLYCCNPFFTSLISISDGSSTAISTTSKPIFAIFGNSSSIDAVVKGEVHNQVLTPYVMSKAIRIN